MMPAVERSANQKEQEVAAQVSGIDEYVRGFPDPVREILERIRRTIIETVPDSNEKISYGMPTITLNGLNIVHFAAWKEHIAFYPLPAGDADFTQAIAPYRGTKNTARFPYREPIPYELIKRLVILLAER